MRLARAVFCLLLLAALSAAPAGATVFRAGTTVSVEADEVIDDDLFIAGSSVLVAGQVLGDVIAAG